MILFTKGNKKWNILCIVLQVFVDDYPDSWRFGQVLNELLKVLVKLTLGGKVWYFKWSFMRYNLQIHLLSQMFEPWDGVKNLNH